MSDSDWSDTDRSDSDGQRSADDQHHHSADDTVEIQRAPSLADDLLRHGVDGSAPVSSGSVGPVSVGTAPVWVEPVEDDEDYYEPPKKRSRVTTGLVVALIFLVGMFVGVTVSRLLPSQQRPQVVYLLNNDGAPSGSSSMPSTFPSGMPSGAATGVPASPPSGMAGGPSGAPSSR